MTSPVRLCRCASLRMLREALIRLDVKAMLQVLLAAEQCAVRGYIHICNLTLGKDHCTYDLALAILHEEIAHDAWFAEFLGHGPSGHNSREGRPNSPYLRKFLNAEQG